MSKETNQKSCHRIENEFGYRLKSRSMFAHCEVSKQQKKVQFK